LYGKNTKNPEHIMYESIDVGRSPKASNRKVTFALAGTAFVTLSAVLVAFLSG
jgi:hypothetical protein